MKELSYSDSLRKSIIVRSRYFHGKELDKDNTFSKIPEMLQRMDAITRVILTRIVMKDSDIFLKPDMEEYFTQLIFL